VRYWTGLALPLLAIWLCFLVQPSAGRDPISPEETIAWSAREPSPPIRSSTTEGEVSGNDAAMNEPAPDVAEPAQATAGPAELSSPTVRLPDGKQTADVDEYLWDVYRRSPTKKDGHGDFSWKDAAAAERLSLSVKEYVITGMDPDFREQLYQAGRAMDAAGIPWTILSGFRDDYRQSIATGFKAHPGRSFHGGSISTGGYGHGCAADLGGIDHTSNGIVWQWLNLHGMEFGLQQPLAKIDPAHVQPRGAWHAIGAALRLARMQKGGHDVSEIADGAGPLLAGPLDAGSLTELACTHPRLRPDTLRGAVGMGAEPWDRTRLLMPLTKGRIGSPLATTTSIPGHTVAIATNRINRPAVTAAEKSRLFWSAHQARVKTLTAAVHSKWARLAQHSGRAAPGSRVD
jgi:hypothetical protein